MYETFDQKFSRVRCDRYLCPHILNQKPGESEDSFRARSGAKGWTFDQSRSEDVCPDHSTGQIEMVKRRQAHGSN